MIIFDDAFSTDINGAFATIARIIAREKEKARAYRLIGSLFEIRKRVVLMKLKV